MKKVNVKSQEKKEEKEQERERKKEQKDRLEFKRLKQKYEKPLSLYERVNDYLNL